MYKFVGHVEVPQDNYAVPAGCAASAVLVALLLCFLCHRKLKRRVPEVAIDDLQQRVEERHHCYHHHNLLHHYQTQSHRHSHNFNQYQIQEPSPPSESEAEQEHVCGDDASSPDSVWPWMLATWYKTLRPSHSPTLLPGLFLFCNLLLLLFLSLPNGGSLFTLNNIHRHIRQRSLSEIN